MVDFLIISTKQTKNGVEIFPKFRLYPKSQDLMIRGGDFYAIWRENIKTAFYAANRFHRRLCKH